MFFSLYKFCTHFKEEKYKGNSHLSKRLILWLLTSIQLYINRPQQIVLRECTASIITGLSHNSSLTYLDISNSHFNMENVDILASILSDQSKCTLTVLGLQDCHISEQGANELAAALCKNSTLKHLELEHNLIGVQWACSMSDL